MSIKLKFLPCVTPFICLAACVIGWQKITTLANHSFGRIDYLVLKAECLRITQDEHLAGSIEKNTLLDQEIRQKVEEWCRLKKVIIFPKEGIWAGNCPDYTHALVQYLKQSPFSLRENLSP